MNTTLEQLKSCSDIGALRPVLLSICSRFGSIARLDILAAEQAGKRQALCFLRMDSAEQEQHLISELGVGRFGGDIVVIVDLRSHDEVNEPRMPADAQRTTDNARALHLEVVDSRTGIHM